MSAISSTAINEVSQRTASAKSSPITFSANAPEFVPQTNFFSKEAPEFVPSSMKKAPEFPPYQTNDFSSYPTTNCMMISLDGYSDESDEDEPQVKPALPEAAIKGDAESTSEDECTTPTTSRSKFSPQSASSDEGSLQTMELARSSCSSTLESEASDKDLESDQEGPGSAQVLAPCFDVPTLLKLRESVDWREGIEDRLAAMEVPSVEAPSKPVPPARKDPPTVSKRPSQPRKNFGGECTKKSQEPRRSQTGGFDPNRGEDSTKLTASEGAWVAQQRARRSSQATESLSDEDVLRAMKCILNKLTIDKFVPLFEKLVSCGIQTTFHLESLISEVFEKATTQHHFINMYADLCVCLHKHYLDHPISDDPKKSFKKVLLNGCQSFFERNLQPPQNMDSLPEMEREEFSYKCKMRMLGNIKFVGALLVRQMLASKVMFAIIDELLSEPTAETLESLACLLTVVGPSFDVPELQARSMLIAVFDKVQALTKFTSVNCRVRCLLKDVLELRACGWKDKKPKKIEGPSTLKEVADQQANEQAGSGKSSQSASRRPTGKISTSSPHMSYNKKSPSSPHTSYNKTAPNQHEQYGGKPWARKPQASTGYSTAPAKVPVQADGYQRINSLAGLFGRKVAVGAEKPKGESVDAGAGKPRSRKQPDVEVFDQEEFRKEVAAALAELRTSREVSEAILRVSALKVPSARQPEELCEMLGHASEDGCEFARKACFDLVAGLFAGGHWKPNALNKGLQDFTEEVCVDLKCDVPMLPRILRDELHPALVPLVQNGILQGARHDALVAVF